MTSTEPPSVVEQQAQLSRFESRDEDEVNAFISDTYVGAHSRLGEVRDEARFRAATVITPQIYGGYIRSSIDYGGTSDPFEHQLFYVVANGQVAGSQTSWIHDK